MQSLSKFAEAMLGIISEASKSLLGILALLIIVVGILAYSFFGVKLTPKNAGVILIVRFCAFLLVFSGACAFGWAVVRTLPTMAAQNIPAAANQQKENTTAVQHHNKPSVLPPVTTAVLPVAARPVAGGYQSEIARAAVLAGKHNVPGNPAQACESYARALRLVYSSLTPNERDLLRTHESACSQGQSEEHVTILKEIALQFEARTKSRDQ